MTYPDEARPVYLRPGELFAYFHPARPDRERDLAVLLLPPFGWDAVCSYRCLREWAQELAAEGYSSLRLSLPGTGDSFGGPRDPGLLDTWTEAVSMAAEQLREASDPTRVAAIGIGLGGFVAARALAAAGALDDLVLWAAPSRGRALVRELQIFGRLESGGMATKRARGNSLRDDSDSVDPPEEGSIEAGGFLLSAETAQALKATDLAQLDFAGPADRRALVFDRDGITVDDRLTTALRNAGIEVTIAPGPGYSAMMSEPQDARAPVEVIATTLGWLAAGSTTRPVSPQPPAARRLRAASTTAEWTAQGTRLRETPTNIDSPGGTLFGILTEPVDGASASVCVLLLNAGAIHHIGPNRMWVEMARRWAALGVASMRLDLSAIGDADGDREASRSVAARYAPETMLQIRAAIDALEERGLPPRVVLIGLCSGAYWAFQGALADERVAAAFMVNSAAFFWDPDVSRMRELRWSLSTPDVWRRALRGNASLSRLLALLRWSPRAPAVAWRRALARRRARRTDDELDRALDRLRDRGQRLLLLFSGREPLLEELEGEGRIDRLGRWPNVHLQTLPGELHSLRGGHAQRSAHAAVDLALKGELATAEALTGGERILS